MLKVLVLLLSLAGHLRSEEEVIKTWGAMKEEWFLQIGEKCDPLDDTLNHFDLFYDLRGKGGSKSKGVPITLAKNLAQRRCLKDTIDGPREFSCFNGICDCADSGKVYSPADGACKKFDGQSCRKASECIAGYICDRIGNQPNLGALKTQNTVLRENQIMAAVIDVNVKEEEYLVLQREVRRRNYFAHMAIEVPRVIGLIEFITGSLSDKGNTEDDTKLKAVIDNPSTPGLLKDVLESYQEPFKQIQNFLKIDERTLKTKPTKEQTQTIEALRDRIKSFTDLNYIYDSVGDKSEAGKSSKYLHIALHLGKEDFTEVKKNLNRLRRAVCLCEGVASVNLCITTKVTITADGTVKGGKKEIEGEGGSHDQGFQPNKWVLIGVFLLVVMH